MRSFSFLPSRLILVHPPLPPFPRPFTFPSHIILVIPQSHTLLPFRPTSSSSAPSHIPFYLSVPHHPRQPLQSHALLPFHFIQHFVPPLRFFSPCPRPSGKVPGFPAKTVHFPPRPTGALAPQASLAALGISTPGESAGFSCENGSLSPVAGRGTGSTGLSGRTWHFHLRGKCRVFLRKWFTFPGGRQGYRLHRPLWPHLQSLPPGKVPGFPAKTVHFPPQLVGVSALQVPLAALGISTSGESAGFFRENGSLSPAAGRGTGSTGLSRATWHFYLRGKCRTFRRKRFTFPRVSVVKIRQREKTSRPRL